jgi:hypothetical protein
MIPKASRASCRYCPCLGSQHEQPPNFLLLFLPWIPSNTSGITLQTSKPTKFKPIPSIKPHKKPFDQLTPRWHENFTKIILIFQQQIEPKLQLFNPQFCSAKDGSINW